MPETKLLTIVGARPQFVKAAIVSLTMKDFPQLREVIVHTGQHFDANMSDIFFRELGIPEPIYKLNINSLNHGAMTGRMMEEIERILLKEAPDYCLVYGDTNSTLAGALAAKKLHIKVIHVEAGLRSFNMKMPEEINRILTDRISDVLFCPTTTAMQNLDREGFAHFQNQRYLSGDVMEDAARFFADKQPSTGSKNLNIAEPYILATIHRAENTDDAATLKRILSALNALAQTHRIVIPLHPRTQKIIRQLAIPLACTVIPPLGYLDMLQYIKQASLIITDSGGLQKEAFFFRKHCITLREETEWTELTDHGYNHLAGTDEQAIISLSNNYFGHTITDPVNLYGHGTAAAFICRKISLEQE